MCLHCNYWNIEALRKESPEPKSESSAEEVKPVYESNPHQE